MKHTEVRFKLNVIWTIIALIGLLSGCGLHRPDIIDQQMYACMDKGNTITTVHMNGYKSYISCEKINK